MCVEHESCKAPRPVFGVLGVLGRGSKRAIHGQGILDNHRTLRMLLRVQGLGALLQIGFSRMIDGQSMLGV